MDAEEQMRLTGLLVRRAPEEPAGGSLSSTGFSSGTEGVAPADLKVRISSAAGDLPRLHQTLNPKSSHQSQILETARFKEPGVLSIRRDVRLADR